MNTYDDNLHSTVVSSLTAQELEIKKINAQLTASMFKLYYAEGSRITASDKLEKAKKDLKKKTAVKKQAVKNSNISTNMLMSATQSKAYVDQSTTNSAVGAANVQIAANAILKLAGDMGNIYSIVSAADYDTEIFEHSKEAYSLMNTTAYHAEKVSQHAMEASYLTAEVSMNTVSDKAKGANNAMKEMLKVADSDFAKSSETVAQDNEKYAVASTKEQASEGELEDVNVEFTATKSAYGLMNKELNLNLLVNPNTVTSNQFTLSFSALKSPFNPPHMASDDDDKKPKTSGIQDLVSPKRQKGSGFLRLKLPLGYPVETYSAIIVKSEKKGTFTISDAENIIQKNSRWFTKISPVETIPPKKKTGKPTVKARHKIEETIQIFGKLDSDGDKIVCGQDYVVFIMAEYVKEYKRLINNFDNYLSAPSPEFCMTYALVAPDYGTFSYIKTTPGPAAPSSGKPSKGDPGKDIKDGDGVTDTTPKQMTSFFNFQTAYAENQGMEVQYRCMFLAAGEKITEGLLTVNGLKTIERETERLERISNHYDPKIAEATTTYNSLLDKNNTVEEKLGPAISTLEELEIQLLKDGPNLNDEEFKKLEAKVQKQRDVVAELHKVNDSLTKAMDKAKAELTKYKTQKKKAISKINFTDEGTAGLFFNLQIAEQVPDGNYTPATAIEVPSTNLQPPKSNSTASGDKVTTTKTPTTWEALIKDDTTDNFGNPLVIGNLYVPVVLSYSTAAEEVANEFTNAITNYALTPAIIYAGTNN